MQLTSTDDVTVHSLSALLEARSVAVVGASDRQGTVGRQVVSQLQAGGFAGRIYPITPTHREVGGLTTVPSVSDIGQPVDLSVLAVADHRLEALLGAALEAGSRSVVIFSPAVGVASTGLPLRERLAEMARKAAVPLCGPNGMGFVNLDHRLRVCGFFQPSDLKAGPITFLSHSGSLFSAMLHNRRPLCFNLVVSSGAELVVTMDQYLVYAVEQPTTRVIGLFLETVRHPAAMAAALTLARTRDIPVVALKAGRSPRGREAAATHSGALAGEDAVYSAYFESHGVHKVDSMAEMMDTLEVFASARRARGGGLGSVHDSGGERTLLLDHAETNGVPIASISKATRERLTEILDPGLEPDNPVDAWGTGHDSHEVFGSSLRALAKDPAVGLLALAVDLTAEESPDAGYVGLLTEIQQESGIPVVVLSNLVDGIDPDQAQRLRQQGIPVLQGTETGLKAIGHALQRANRPPNSKAAPSAFTPLPDRWRQRLLRPGPLFEQEALALVGDYGIPVVESIAAASIEETMAAFERVAGPVVVKTAASLHHKADVDGVRLGLKNALEVAEAYHDLAERLGPHVVVQPMIANGVELAMGIVFDREFGPLVMVAAGGRLVEVLEDRVLALAPIDATDADRMLDKLRMARVLQGVRGSPPVNRGAVIDALVRLSVLATALGDLVAAVDVNPLIAGPWGVVAVDALIIPSIHSS